VGFVVPSLFVHWISVTRHASLVNYYMNADMTAWRRSYTHALINMVVSKDTV
jgi:hypothetical protein